MLPTQQRLEALDPPRVDPHDRVVDEMELAPLHGSPQRVLQRQTRARLRVHALAEDLVTRAASLLGLVHRRVRVAKDLLGAGVGRLAQGDPDARRDEDLLGPQVEGFPQRLVVPNRRRPRVVDALDVLQQHHELVAAEPRQGVGLPQVATQPIGDADEQRVAHRVAEAVVHVLEAVQIDEEHRELVVLATLLTPHGALEPLHQERPVGEAGQPVVVGVVTELVLGELACRDVGLRARDPAWRAVGVAHRLGASEHPVVGAILVAHPMFALEVRALAQQVLVEHAPDRAHVVGVDAVEPLVRAQPNLVVLVAQHPLPTRGEVDDPGLQAPIEDAVVGPTDSQLVALAAALERRLGLDQLSDLLFEQGLVRLNLGEGAGVIERDRKPRHQLGHHVGAVAGRRHARVEPDLEPPEKPAAGDQLVRPIGPTGGSADLAQEHRVPIVVQAGPDPGHVHAAVRPQELADAIEQAVDLSVLRQLAAQRAHRLEPARLALDLRVGVEQVVVARLKLVLLRPELLEHTASRDEQPQGAAQARIDRQRGRRGDRVNAGAFGELDDHRRLALAEEARQRAERDGADPEERRAVAVLLRDGQRNPDAAVVQLLEAVEYVTERRGAEPPVHRPVHHARTGDQPRDSPHGAMPIDDVAGLGRPAALIDALAQLGEERPRHALTGVTDGLDVDGDPGEDLLRVQPGTLRSDEEDAARATGHLVHGEAVFGEVRRHGPRPPAGWEILTVAGSPNSSVNDQLSFVQGTRVLRSPHEPCAGAPGPQE